MMLPFTILSVTEYTIVIITIILGNANMNLIFSPNDSLLMSKS